MLEPYSAWLTAAVLALDVCAVARALVRSGGAESTLAWIFAILAFPGVGAIAFFALASPGVRRTTRRRRRRMLEARATGGAAPEVPAADDPMLQLCASLTGLPATRGNVVQLLAGDVAAFRRIESVLRSATRSVWAEYYLIRRDETGQRFLDLLAEKARAGLDVRLLFDAFGSFFIDGGRLEAIRAAGGKVEAFLPLNPLRRRWALHLRNHRKLIVVDGETGFTGGMNVGDEYSGRARRRGREHFRDSHLEIRGPAVGDLAQVFAEDWSFAADENLEPPPDPPPDPEGAGAVAVIPSGPDQEKNANAFLYFTGLATARERVWLSSPYFIPDDAMLRVLCSAALRGVDVRVLLPARCDVALVGPTARFHYGRLLRSGVRIFEYQPSMLHAKSMVVDGRWAVVGSANVDMRSFRLNFEMSVLVGEQSFAARLERRFEADLSSSREVGLEEVAACGQLRRLGRGVARLLSPLL